MRGIRPYLLDQSIRQLVIREPKLRWPIPKNLPGKIKNQRVRDVERKGKYILIHLDTGGLLMHLGMSGSFRVLLTPESPGKHDHFDIVNYSGQIIRYRDPRKFGCLLYSSSNIYDHPRLLNLGIEPFSPEFTGAFLYKKSKTRKVPVKTLIMDGKIVVGVGNIYASEALFDAGINPNRNCSRIAQPRFNRLVDSIQQILNDAIEKGGTTLQDFTAVDGSPGYFEQSLGVYGRENQPCIICQANICKSVISQRSTFFCPKCQR